MTGIASAAACDHRWHDDRQLAPAVRTNGMTVPPHMLQMLDRLFWGLKALKQIEDVHDGHSLTAIR